MSDFIQLPAWWPNDIPLIDFMFTIPQNKHINWGYIMRKDTLPNPEVKRIVEQRFNEYRNMRKKESAL